MVYVEFHPDKSAIQSVHRDIARIPFRFVNWYSVVIMPHKKKLTATSLSVSVQLIERRIYLIRGQKVMIDFDLAELYGVSTKRLNQQVTRNKSRFPDDFMFRLSKEEAI